MFNILLTPSINYIGMAPLTNNIQDIVWIIAEALSNPLEILDRSLIWETYILVLIFGDYRVEYARFQSELG